MARKNSLFSVMYLTECVMMNVVVLTPEPDRSF